MKNIAFIISVVLDASTFNQETYPPWQCDDNCEDNTRDVVPPAYDSVMSSDKLTLVK